MGANTNVQSSYIQPTSGIYDGNIIATLSGNLSYNEYNPMLQGFYQIALSKYANGAFNWDENNHEFLISGLSVWYQEASTSAITQQVPLTTALLTQLHALENISNVGTIYVRFLAGIALKNWSNIEEQDIKYIALSLVNTPLTKPILSVATTLMNGLNGSYIKGKSACQITMSATGKYNATISSYRIQGSDGSNYLGSSTTVSLPTNTAGSITYTITVTDSRGSTNTTTKTITVLDYANPAFSSISLQRSNSSGAAQADGAYATLTATYSFSSTAGNSVTRKLFWRETGSASWTEVAGGFNSGEAKTFGGSLDITKSYDVLVRLTDTFNPSIDYYDFVSVSMPMLDFKKGGDGIGVGIDATENQTLDVNWITKFRKQVYIGTEKLSKHIRKVGNDGFALVAASNSFNPSTGQLYTANECDFLCTGTDDQVKINTALSQGAAVRLAKGTYNLSAAITLSTANYQTLEGCGTGTVLRRSPATAFNAISTTSNNHIIRDLQIQGGNNSIGGVGIEINSSYIHVYNCMISNFVAGIYFQDERGECNIHDNLISACSNNGIYLNTGWRNVCTSNTILQGINGITVNGSKSVVISSNRIQDTTSTGIWLTNTPLLVDILGNSFFPNNGHGITKDSGEGVSIVNNNIWHHANSGGRGISVGGGNTVITGNHIRGNVGSGQTGSNQGIVAAGGGNVVVGNIARLCGDCGIVVSNNNNTVTGNVCLSNYYGLVMDGNSGFSNVLANICGGNRGAGFVNNGSNNQAAYNIN